MAGSVLGEKVLRKEDPKFLTTGGVYIDDFSDPRIGSTPAVHSAVVDALGHLGVRHIDMPCTPEKVWRVIEAASN